MSTWQDRAKIAVRDMLSVGNSARWGWLFVSGARWQREALLSDDAIERAARGFYENRVALEDPEERRSWPTWEDHERRDADSWRDAARAALTAATGGDDE